jgi:hypothetical protein
VAMMRLVLPLNNALFPTFRTFMELGIEQLQNQVQRHVLSDLAHLHLMA